MEFDLMYSPRSWRQTADLAAAVEHAGFSGMVLTETSQTPWMSMAVAAQAAPSLQFSTGIAVAFPRSPMVTASLAWELAGNTNGRFRLGLGSQVKAHVERRYGCQFDPPGPRLRDYVEAVKACFRAFRGEEPLSHSGPFYQLSLLPAAWAPARHGYGDIPVDVSAVGPWMCRMAGEVADGVHVHPLHSTDYLRQRLLPAVSEGAARAGRPAGELELIVPVFAVPGDTEEERAPLLQMARQQIAFYGSTRNYAFQFDDLGFEGTSARLNDRLKAGDMAGFAATITDEILAHFAVAAPWDRMAGALLDRYQGVAGRLVMYLAAASIERNPGDLERWGKVARAVRSGGDG
ncbi:MAG TPA: TIGR03617 family F420-dependent LLM class oxidoreductase [Acidimicrobiales bacterium]|nr:TIGR03617 family F420-dependent LLM class oxidoreductase [Acidimicrobiales bacterium]